MGNECCRCDCEQDKHIPIENDISIITQSEVGEDNYWRGCQPGYEKAGQFLSSEYVKQAGYLIDAFDSIQQQHKNQKFEEYNQSLETAIATRDSQKYSTQLGGRRKQDLKQKVNGEQMNSDEKIKESFFNEDQSYSDRRSSLCKYCPSQSNNNHQYLHTSSHSHLSSSHKAQSNRSNYSNSVIKYGI